MACAAFPPRLRCAVMRCRGAIGALLLLVPVGVAVHGAAPVAGAAAPATCGGTVAAPQALPAGTYASLDVTGVCHVSAGAVVVTGSVTVEAGAALVSAYGLANDVPGTASSLTIGGN